MASPDTDTIEVEVVPPPETSPGALFRACVLWQIRRGDRAAVKALTDLDPWRRA